MLRKEISPESEISGGNAGILTAKYAIRRFCGSPARWYGLENSSNIVEYVPLFAKTKHTHKLTREPYKRTIKRGNTGASAPVVAVPEVKAEEEENDVFSDELRKAREEATQAAATTLIGGDTASFQPLVIDEDVEDDDLLADGELGREEDID